MTQRIILSPRLAAAAELIGPGSVVDVGTDHGYLPVYLAQSDPTRILAASDVREGPLASARASAEEYGVTQRIAFSLRDGLDGCARFDNVVIAGMGGETILQILRDVPWIRDGVKLILQPQSKQPELAAWLDSQGFCIEDARLVLDAGRYYAAVRAVYDGGKRHTPVGEAYIPRPALESKNALCLPYARQLIGRFTEAKNGIASGKHPETAELSRLDELIEDLTRIAKESEAW